VRVNKQVSDAQTPEAMMIRAVSFVLSRKLRRLDSSGCLDFVLLIFLSPIFLSVSFLPPASGKPPNQVFGKAVMWRLNPGIGLLFVLY